MTDMNNRSMNDNNENRNNDPKERMRKKVRKQQVLHYAQFWQADLQQVLLRV